MAGKPGMAGHGLLRGARPCSRNVSPSETDTTWGRPRERERSRETGFSCGYLAPAGGARCRQGQATDQPARRGRAGPLHLIHGGALPDSAQPERPCRDRHAAAAGTPAAMTRAAAKVRSPGGRATTAGGKRGSRRVRRPDPRRRRASAVRLLARSHPGRARSPAVRRAGRVRQARLRRSAGRPGTRGLLTACAQTCG